MKIMFEMQFGQRAAESARQRQKQWPRRPGAVALGLGNRGVKIFAFPLIFLFAVVAGALFVNAFGPGLGPR